MERVSHIGLDIAKNFFQVHANNEHGKKLFNKKLTRAKVLEFFVNTPPCIVGIEACGEAHHWAREIAQFGHEVRLIAPHIVKPFVMGNKTDAADAQAICEVLARPSTPFVPIKTVEQQLMASQCKMRDRLMQSRTQVVNQARGILYEFGIIAPQGVEQAKKLLVEISSPHDADYPMELCEFALLFYEEILTIEARIDHITKKIEHIARTNPLCKLAMTVPGVGPLGAVNIVAHVGDASQFENGRTFSACLGLTPREHSSGGKQRLSGITKRGNSTCRYLLIQGARNQGRYWGACDAGDDRRKQWYQGVLQRRNKFVAAVALANKTARILWAVLTSRTPYNVALA